MKQLKYFILLMKENIISSTPIIDTRICLFGPDRVNVWETLEF